MQDRFVPVTPERIRALLLKVFPELKEVKGKIRVPENRWNEFQEKYTFIRRLEVVSDAYKRKEEHCSQLIYDLSFYRGDFDSEVNAYKVSGVVPRKVFDKARKEGLLFSVRFKSMMLEDNPEGVLFWYVHEKVSL